MSSSSENTDISSSSSESSANEDVEESDEIPSLTYIWKIQNFSYCIEQQWEALESPPFSIRASDEPDWKIRLYPRGEEDIRHIALFLQNLSSSDPEPSKTNSEDNVGSVTPLICDVELSLLSLDGKSLLKWEEDVCMFGLGHDVIKGTSMFASREEVCDIKRKIFLPDDTLTVCCRIKTLEIVTTGKYCATTQIGVNRMSFTWNIKNFSEIPLNDCPTTSVNFGSKMKFNLKLSFGKKQKLKLIIKPNILLCNRFCKCKIDILDDKGKECISAQSDFNFVRGSIDIWQFSLNTTRKDILTMKDTVLLNDVLTLRCIFTVSVGDQLLEIDDCQTSLCPFLYNNESLVSNNINTLKDDVLSLYRRNKLTDVDIRVGNTTFPAHKSILAARSTKFFDLFQNTFPRHEEEEEPRTVHTSSILEETMRNMLHFMYTDSIEDMHWVDMDLFSLAANEYGIKSLKEKIPLVVESKLSISNVCDILPFLESGLQDCRIIVLNFIILHDTEIIQSESWKTFVKSDPQLSANILQEMYLKKISN